MPPDTHIEMLNAEAERQPEPSKETGPDLEALSLAAADLGRRLVWLPGTRSSRFFSERYGDLRSTKEGFKRVRKLPHVRTPDGAVAPRVVALAAGFLATSGYDFSESSLVAYV